MKCPRCLGEQTHVCKEGREGQELVWTMYYCDACDFNWRDSEPQETLDPALRPPDLQVDTSNIGRYAVIIPPRR